MGPNAKFETEYLSLMKVDGRKLNHAKLEEICFEAVKAIQAGETPSRVARRMGLTAHHSETLRNKSLGNFLDRSCFLNGCF